MASAVSFDPESLLAQARRRTGLEDFGDPRFREPMERLLFSLDREARLTESGRIAQREHVVGSLMTRLSGEKANGKTRGSESRERRFGRSSLRHPN